MADSFVKFDEHGDGLARYTIYNYQKKTNGIGYDYKVRFLRYLCDYVWNTFYQIFFAFEQVL